MFAECAAINATTSKPTESGPIDKRIEIRGLLALLLLTNLGLVLGNTPASNLIFQPVSVASGEWWRILSWPFVHVSRYHLLIDGIAFLLLYSGLQEHNRYIRLSYALWAAVGSLMLPLLLAPEIAVIGLCGLSGPAHGLMAITALELRTNSKEKRLGKLLLYGLLLKTGFELVSGTAFLQQLHIGDIGQPIVSTHAGGVVAGAALFKIRNALRKNPVPHTDPLIRKQGTGATSPNKQNK